MKVVVCLSMPLSTRCNGISAAEHCTASSAKGMFADLLVAARRQTASPWLYIGRPDGKDDEAMAIKIIMNR